jgi:Ca-activated chloride channel family protein
MRLLLPLLLLLTPGAGQETIRVDVHLINVAFSVLDANGGFVNSLTRDDFGVFEDNVPQKISFFAHASEIPLHLGLAADFSGSQSKSIKPHHNDLETFLKTVVTPRDDVFLLCFASRLRLAQDVTSDARAIVDSLDDFEHYRNGKRKANQPPRQFPELGPHEIRPPSTDTAFFDAVYESVRLKLSDTAPGRKALVVFSDGDDNSSARDEVEAIEIAQRCDTVLFSVRYTETARNGSLTARNKNGITVLERMAHDTGGAHFDARDKGLATHFRQIGDQLRSSYELAYHAANPVSDGSFRKIVIRAKPPGLTVRAKTGYVAR